MSRLFLSSLRNGTDPMSGMVVTFFLDLSPTEYRFVFSLELS